MKAMIIEKFNKEFHKLYYLMKAYWYGFEEYENIKDYDSWSSNLMDEMLERYSGPMLIKDFIGYVEKELKTYMDSYKKLLN